MIDMPEYEVYAIKYGDHQRMRQENFLFNWAKRQRQAYQQKLLKSPKYH